MPWYHSSNTGRIATIKNKCNLFIEVKRLGASGTARVCESESDFSNSFDAIFSYALRKLRQFRPAWSREVSENSSRSHGCFLNGDLRAC